MSALGSNFGWSSALWNATFPPRPPDSRAGWQCQDRWFNHLQPGEETGQEEIGRSWSLGRPMPAGKSRLWGLWPPTPPAPWGSPAQKAGQTTGSWQGKRLGREMSLCRDSCAVVWSPQTPPKIPPVLGLGSSGSRLLELRGRQPLCPRVAVGAAAPV